jgi:hypothetical protein
MKAGDCPELTLSDAFFPVLRMVEAWHCRTGQLEIFDEMKFTGKLRALMACPKDAADISRLVIDLSMCIFFINGGSGDL